jgi:hypothetical protein
MIAAVDKFGWIDQASQSIRAHIEYTPNDAGPVAPGVIEY